jgi:tripartite-type tricarboxylate transporter receptor subunit TctC
VLRRSFGCLTALIALAFAVPAHAQDYPSQPIKIIVPTPAGGIADVVGRTLAQKLSESGKTAVVENRTGGAGAVAADAVAKAPPDGHTLLIAMHQNIAILPSLGGKLPYDASKDFAPITNIVGSANILVINPSVPAKSMKELVDYAKANPGKMNYASAGAGSGAHLNGERFRMATGTQMQHIAYKGGPEALTGVMSGDCDFYFVPLPPARGPVQAGKLAILAVSGSKRSTALPDVPTTVEAGFPNSDYDFWVGFWAPAATPKPILDKLHAETMKALDNPAVKAKLANVGGDPLPMSPAQFEAFVKKEIEVNGALVKAAGVKVN